LDRINSDWIRQHRAIRGQRPFTHKKGLVSHSHDSCRYEDCNKIQIQNVCFAYKRGEIILGNLHLETNNKPGLIKRENQALKTVQLKIDLNQFNLKLYQQPGKYITFNYFNLL